MDDGPPHRWTYGVAHAASFLGVGAAAFLIDAGLLILLTACAHLPPLVARVPSIIFAMIFGWLMNRAFTFPTSTPHGVAEFLRYAAVAGSSALVNYGMYATALILRPGLPLLAALFVSCALAAVTSYAGYRWLVFAPDSENRASRGRASVAIGGLSTSNDEPAQHE